MRRIRFLIVQQSRAYCDSAANQASVRRFNCEPGKRVVQVYGDALAPVARGGIASTSGRTSEAAWQSWSCITSRSQSRLTSIQEQAGAVLANSLNCSSSGQNLLRLWPALLIGNALTVQQSMCAQQEAPPEALPEQADRPGRLSSSWAVAKEEVATTLRGVYLLLLFTPVCLTAPFSIGLGLNRDKWLDLVVWTLERAGPAFIKWGQWAATRPDMFPQDLCQKLASLQSGAPQHSFAYTRKAVEAAFHGTLEELFDEFAERPVASGSIAQIHKARLSEEGARGSEYPQGTVVAVKLYVIDAAGSLSMKATVQLRHVATKLTVRYTLSPSMHRVAGHVVDLRFLLGGNSVVIGQVRHPGVTTLMQRDFTLMHRAAKLSSHLPILGDLHLEESIRQFGAPLKEQLDLLTEAKHLDRFGNNFRTWHNLSFPAPVYPLVAPSVLVETFEEGRLISSYVDKPTNKYSIHLANIGLSCYLQMLLKDNFVHADLHPGNILVRLVDPNTTWGRIATFLKVNTAPKLVLLDVGMVAELTPEDQQNLVGFFKALTSQDGEALGENILSFSEKQTCPNPAAFVDDMKTLFTGLELHSISEHTSEIISDMMEKIRLHQVNLKGVVSTVVVTTMVLEGWSTKLNPDIKIMDALKDILPMSWNERIARTVDKQVMSDAIIGL